MGEGKTLTESGYPLLRDEAAVLDVIRLAREEKWTSLALVAIARWDLYAHGIRLRLWIGLLGAPISRPATSVTRARDQFGVTACSAKPARYRVGFEVVQPATTTATIPAHPSAW